MNWQPIETAPKDGRDLLIFGSGGIVIGWWDDSCRYWCHQDLYLSIDEPTHWMPLPLPPDKQVWD